jgi:hypothetical protein
MSADDPVTTRGFGVKGRTGLLAAAAIVAVLLVSFPAYRVFFLLSLGIGVVIAGGLYLYHRVRPLKEEDIENKRPLGL